MVGYKDNSYNPANMCGFCNQTILIVLSEVYRLHLHKTNFYSPPSVAHLSANHKILFSL